MNLCQKQVTKLLHSLAYLSEKLKISNATAQFPKTIQECNLVATLLARLRMVATPSFTGISRLESVLLKLSRTETGSGTSTRRSIDANWSLGAICSSQTGGRQ